MTRPPQYLAERLLTLHSYQLVFSSGGDAMFSNEKEDYVVGGKRTFIQGYLPSPPAPSEQLFSFRHEIVR